MDKNVVYSLLIIGIIMNLSKLASFIITKKQENSFKDILEDFSYKLRELTIVKTYRLIFNNIRLLFTLSTIITIGALVWVGYYNSIVTHKYSLTTMGIYLSITFTLGLLYYSYGKEFFNGLLGLVLSLIVMAIIMLVIGFISAFFSNPNIKDAIMMLTGFFGIAVFTASYLLIAIFLLLLLLVFILIFPLVKWLIERVLIYDKGVVAAIVLLLTVGLAIYELMIKNTT